MCCEGLVLFCVPNCYLSLGATSGKNPGNVLIERYCEEFAL